MTYYIVMEYIESPLFSKLLRSYFTDDQYAAFQWELSLHPKAGDLILEVEDLERYDGLLKIVVNEVELGLFIIIKWKKSKYGY